MKKPGPKLSPSMTIEEFDNGYWYAADVRDFAKDIGIPGAAKLRKDELEKAIKHFLKTGKPEVPTKRNLSKIGEKDLEKGLSLDLPVVNYTSNKETKDFIVSEARKIVPDLRKKSGARYRLNRWREEQLTSGIPMTYRDLVNKYIELNQQEGSFARVPIPRYVNFLSDFLKNEKGATREQAIRAWEEVKKMYAPKTYDAWKNYEK
jgi:hypothetical protein